MRDRSWHVLPLACTDVATCDGAEPFHDDSDRSDLDVDAVFKHVGSKLSSVASGGPCKDSDSDEGADDGRPPLDDCILVAKDGAKWVRLGPSSTVTSSHRGRLGIALGLHARRFEGADVQLLDQGGHAWVRAQSADPRLLAKTVDICIDLVFQVADSLRAPSEGEA